MSGNDRWLLPEGIEEALPPQATRLESLRRQLLDLYRSWGYELIMPPFIEFLDSLLTGVGTDLDLQTFKLTDQMTGRMMGVRADITPQAARIDAHSLKRECPVRLCYMGTVLRTRPESQGGTRSPLQIGAELYGHAGVESDAEILRLMLETLALTGVRNVHVDIGHVGIFRGLARQAGLDSEQETVMFEALQRKARPEIESCLQKFGVDKKTAPMLVSLTELNGDEQILAEAETCLKKADKPVRAALDNLRQLTRTLRMQGEDTPLFFDLAELRGYGYHTGMVFAAYIEGQGQAVAQGGRYDQIGSVFGRARPATGFSADLKILTGLTTARDETPVAIYAPWSDDATLNEIIRSLRADGECVVCALPGQSGNARELGCGRALEQKNGEWLVVNI